MKRKAPATETVPPPKNATPKKRRTQLADDEEAGDIITTSSPNVSVKSRTPKRTRLSKSAGSATGPVAQKCDVQLDDDVGSPTPKANGMTLFATPTKRSKLSNVTPSKTKNIDRSAKRKSVRTLLERPDEDDWEGEAALAEEILDEDELLTGNEGANDAREKTQEEDGLLPETPSKRGRGRPKGARNRRSPTPEGDIPPEERYFYQNRSGPPQVSNNTLASLKLLTHDEYFAEMRRYKDPHDPEKAYLLRLHARSFPQWRFEFVEGFNICLYGWGSKRALVTSFAQDLYRKMRPTPKIIVVNAYVPKTTIRTILSLLAETIMGDSAPKNLGAQSSETVDLILSHISTHTLDSTILLLINSIDFPSFRRQAHYPLLARLSSHPSIHLLATTDTPTSPLLWDSNLRSQFKFLFHDCTTYAPYEAELNVVDDVHELLGRKGHRIGGKEGVGFVLKSLPENARNLYRVLLTEILTVLSDGLDSRDSETAPQDSDDDDDPTTHNRSQRAKAQADGGEIGIEYHTLYTLASSEFICSSEMSFRTLLKEFHDHQMIVSRRDASGTEVLGVPLGREDMEGVLEELVVG